MEQHVSDYIEQIQAELADGFGFVPLLGAGISAESGVPLIPEMRAYLGKCIARALGISDNKDEELKRRWMPATDTWPAFRNLREDEETRVNDRISAKLKNLREAPDWDPEIPIIQEALGSLGNWRSALMFLAQLRMDQTGRGKGRLRLGPPNYDVIDAYFRYATGGRKPTLPHHMLALLAQPMRFGVLLTTNFDELIEDAFHEAETPLDPVDVHVHAALPSFRHIGQRRALIKLHGGRYGLRADYTLDQDPTQEELNNFASYFYPSEFASHPERNKGKWHVRNHLLVIGMSAEDRRIVQFLKHAMDLSRDAPEYARLKVFWICYSQMDESNIHSVLKEQLGAKVFQDRCHVIRHMFTGLLLAEIWQELTKTLPPKFAIFPSATRISTPPAYLRPCQIQAITRRIESGIDGSGEKVWAHVQRQFYGDYRRDKRLLRLSAKRGNYGVTSKGAYHYYRATERNRKCVWLSLENVSSTDELFEHMTDAIARAAGITDWMPIVLYDQKEKALGEISRLTQGKSKWVVFLDARDGAGTALAPNDACETNPNGWLDRRRHSDSVSRGEEIDDGSSNAEEFVSLLRKLTGYECPQVSVVLLYHKFYEQSARSNGSSEPATNTTGLDDALEAEGFSPTILLENGISHIDRVEFDSDLRPLVSETQDHLNEEGDWNYKHINAVRDAKHWVNAEPEPRFPRRAPVGSTSASAEDRLFFLLALCCSQRIRYPSLLVSDAFHSPQNCHATKLRSLKTRAERVNVWVRQLAVDVTNPVVRRLPGGFVWLHSSVKNELRTIFQVDALDYSVDPSFAESDTDTIWNSFAKGYPIRFAVYRSQTLIARWYERLYLSSHDPQAGLESIYHYLQAATQGALGIRELGSRNELFYQTQPGDLIEKSFSAVPWEQLIDSVVAARQMLARVKSTALASGYPKATCRRLVYLRCRLVMKLLQRIEQGDGNGERIFGLSDLKGHLQITNDEASRKYNKIIRELDKLILEMLVVKRGIAREVSEHTRAFQRHRQRLEYFVEGTTSKAQKLPGTAEDFDAQKALVKQLREKLNAFQFRMSVANDPDETQRIRDKFMATWERHGAVLAIATRAYESAGIGIFRAIQWGVDQHDRSINETVWTSPATERANVGFSLDQLSHADGNGPRAIVNYSMQDSSAGRSYRKATYLSLEKGVESVLENLIDGLSSADFSDRNAQLVPTLKSLNRLIQWVIVVAETLHFASRSPIAIFEEISADHKESHNLAKQQEAFVLERRDKILDLAQMCFDKFNRLIHMTAGGELDSYRSVRQTMETQMSSIFAIQRKFRRGHRCLEAAIELRQQRDPSTNMLSSAIVELHRAQLFLIHALDSHDENGNSVIGGTRSLIGLDVQTRALPETRLEIPELNTGLNLERLDALDQIIKRLALGNLVDRFVCKDKLELREGVKLQRKQNVLLTTSISRLIEDAEIAMSKAEKVLVNKRKNVWWSTWLFELQIKSIEYRLMLAIEKARWKTAERAAARSLLVNESFRKDTIAEKTDAIRHKALRHVTGNKRLYSDTYGSPGNAVEQNVGKKDECTRSWVLQIREEESAVTGEINVADFGSVACPRGDQTIADELLTNTLRMVRLDLVRLSRVVETYTYCYRGLSILQAIDPHIERLPMRLTMMRNMLVGTENTPWPGAISILEKRYAQRIAIPPIVDPLVAIYTQHVINFANQVVERRHNWR